jgi:hypothetical protein
MTPADLTSRVSRDACVLGVAVAGPATWLGGLDAALGALAGVGIALGNFRLLAWRARAADGAASTARSLWSIVAGLRLLAVLGAVGAVLVSGHADPLAVVAGLSVLPVVVVANGLRAARQEA